MSDSEIEHLSPEEKVNYYIKRSHSIKEDYRKLKAEKKKQKKEQKKLEAFQRKQREDKFTLDISKREKWKVGDRWVAQPLNSLDPQPIKDVHPTVLFRTAHLLPRSYQLPEQPFLLTSNYGQVFPQPGESLLTKSGRTILQSSQMKFQDEVERRRQKELEPKKIELGPRWQPGGARIEYFQKPAIDSKYEFDKWPKPNFYQTEPFRRVTRYGDLFTKTATNY